MGYFDYFGHMLVCEHCGEKFHSDDCDRRNEYVDDSRIPAFSVLICPFCGSDELEEWDEDDERWTDN